MQLRPDGSHFGGIRLADLPVVGQKAVDLVLHVADLGVNRGTKPPLHRRQHLIPVQLTQLAAVERDGKPGEDGRRATDFIDCVAWRHTGEFVAKHFTKGRMIVVAGRLQIRNWTDKEGNKRRSAEIIAENVYFGDSNNVNRGADNGDNYQNGDFAELPDDGLPLPFDMPEGLPM